MRKTQIFVKENLENKRRFKREAREGKLPKHLLYLSGWLNEVKLDPLLVQKLGYFGGGLLVGKYMIGLSNIA